MPKRSDIVPYIYKNTDTGTSGKTTTPKSLGEQNRDLGKTYDPKPGRIIPTQPTTLTPTAAPSVATPNTSYTKTADTSSITEPTNPTGAYVPLNTGASVPSIGDQINSLYDSELTTRTAQINSATESAANALAKALSNSLSAQDEAASGLKNAYMEKRNQSAANSDVSKYNYAQTAAAQGIEGNAAMQNELYTNVALQNALGGLNRSQAEDVAAVERAKALLRSGYEGDLTTLYNKRDQDILAAGGAVSAEKTKAMIDQMLRDQQTQEKTDAQTRQDMINTLSQYYGNEDAAIATIQGDGDTSNDWLVNYLKAMKADRMNAPKLTGGSGGGGVKTQTLAQLDSDMNDIYQMYFNPDSPSYNPEAGKQALFDYSTAYGGSYAAQLQSKYGVAGYTGGAPIQDTPKTPAAEVPASLNTVNSITTAVRKMTDQGKDNDYIGNYLSDLVEKGTLTAQQARDIAKNILGITL